MKYSLFEQKLIKRIEPFLMSATPGILVQAHYQGRKVCDIAVGETYAYYDLASLTKIIFSLQAMVLAFQNQKWNLQSKVKEFLPWFSDKETLITDLLSHSAGCAWWGPFYKDLDMNRSKEDRWLQLQKILKELPLEKKEISVYSDIDFLLLAFILEKIYDMPLQDIWREIHELFYQRMSFAFHVDNQPASPTRFYAPTEKCPWRGRILQGEVHDENAWALGGVSTHSGLFGSVDDVSWFALMIRSQLMGVSKNIIKQKTAQVFAARSRPMGAGDWALGYMMPTVGNSSSGDFFSSFSIGHTGFTGTSIWHDPTQDLSICILSNRVAYGRESQGFKKLRPEIHNWVVEGIRRSSF